MELREILAIYESEKRIAIQMPGLRREVLPNLVRHIDSLGHRGMISWSRLDAATADREIREQVEFYSGIKQAFEWKVFGHDQLADLKERLRAFGFSEEPEESVMVLEIDKSPKLKTPSEHFVRSASDLSLLSDLLAVQEAAYGESAEWLENVIAHTLRTAPETLTLYVAYQNGRPVASARIDYEPGTRFAGLWGGVVLPEFRGRGFYLALLAARIEEARTRKCQFVTIDAGPMSRPIVERRGFREMTTTQEFVWGEREDDQAAVC
jgi:GNAT superfamily N-acetyltransferase